MISNSILKKLVYIATAVAIFIVGFETGSYRVSKGIALTTKDKALLSENTRNIGFDLFWDVWDTVQGKFVDAKVVNNTQLINGAIKGIAAAANDPYTFYLTPQENKQAKDDLGGKYEGIGAQLGTRDGAIVVIAPMKNSPAEHAGILAGDIVQAVDDESLEGKNVIYAVSKIRGKGGTAVKLKIFSPRTSQSKEFSIIRQQITVDSVELTYDHQHAVLKLNQFGETTAAEWEKATKKIAAKYQAKEIKGMILDLRNNPGGYLDLAIDVASDFLTQGTLIVKQEGKSSKHEYHTRRDPLLPTIPLIVLINEGSASASEIVAGALVDYKRAKVVGQKSFGKGSVQEVMDLENGGGLHITVAKWILPNGSWIHGKGIQPEYEVKNTPVDVQNTADTPADTQLLKAHELLP